MPQINKVKVAFVTHIIVLTSLSLYLLDLYFPTTWTYFGVTQKGITYYLLLNPPEFFDGYYWQLITSFLVHGGWQHYLYNIMPIYMCGILIERKIGHLKFLACFLAIGISGSVLWLLVSGSPCLGMSGISYGIMPLCIIMFKDEIIKLVGKLAFVQIILICSIHLVLQTVYLYTRPNANVGFIVHGIGMIVGILLGMYICSSSKRKCCGGSKCKK